MIRKRFKVLALVFVLLLVISSATYANPVHRDIFTEVSGDRIFNHIEALASTDNARVTGFDGEHTAADYIARELESYGLNVERQKFPILAFLSKGSAVSMISPAERSFASKTLTYTPPTSPEGITAELVYAGLGSEADFAGLDLTGKIALIKRGSFTFYAKTQNAAKAGAAGVIIFNNQTGMISGTLGAVTDIPAVAITNTDGEYLVNLLNAGQKAAVKLVADTELKESFAQNVIGTLKAERGYGDAKTFVVGAHYDGVDTPAANDNASGTSTMLEVARVLSTQKLAHDVKFIAFGAEEVGLIGSEEYVASLDEQGLNNIAGMINMDMVGVGDKIGVLTVDSNNHSFVADLAETYLQTFGFAYGKGTSSSSDHASFEAAGIPVVFLNYGPDPYYHTDADSLDKINKQNLYNMGTLVTALTYDLAKTPLPQSENGLKAKANKYKFTNDEIAVQ